MIIIVFGLAAAGKTYTGKILSNYFDFYHEDADLWLSIDMQDFVKQQKHFTLNMLEDFTQNIIYNIENLQNKHQNLVISQALYRSHNRETIRDYFLAKKENILFLQVEASDKTIHDRLVSRGDWVLPDYASSMRQFFQPMPESIIINNDQTGEEPIIKQLLAVPEIKAHKRP